MSDLKDCWFYQDTNVPENERKMHILCERCHVSHPNLGWFWKGSVYGYGPYDFICSKCSHVIYKPEKIQTAMPK